MFHIIITKECNRTSIEKFETKEEAIEVMNKKYSDKKFNAKIMFIPKIRSGLKLYRNGCYYKTIIRTTPNLCSLLDVKNNPGDSTDPIRPDRLLELLYEEKLHMNEDDTYDNNYKNNDLTINFFSENIEEKGLDAEEFDGNEE